MLRKLLPFPASLALLSTMGGCVGGGEFREEELPSRAEIEKKIEMVKSNSQIPEATKPNIIKGLEEQLKRAK